MRERVGFGFLMEPLEAHVVNERRRRPLTRFVDNFRILSLLKLQITPATYHKQILANARPVCNVVPKGYQVQYSRTLAECERVSASFAWPSELMRPFSCKVAGKGK
jgi:hypothetical protein